MELSQSQSEQMIASSSRPIPLKVRADLVIAEIDYLGVGYQVIKDPVALKYHRLQKEQFKILSLLDGTRSLEKVRDDFKEAFPTLQVTLSDIQQLITDLHKKGLVVSDRPGQGAAVTRVRRKDRNDKIKQTLMSLMYLRTPGWDPEATLRWMYPYLKWIFWKPVVWLCVLFTCSAWLMLGAQIEEFQSRLPEFQTFFGWPNLIYLWATLGIAKIIHEFGHGLSCHHFGGECHEMGVMLLVFSPCLYCDVTDSWMMKNKWHRIIIGAAGMYVEVIISAIAIYVWWFTKPGLVHFLALNTFFVTTITTVIFNANPLMRFDGYYMMSDFLEIPNLRAKSDKMMKEAFSWYCLGIESRPDPFMPETGKAWFVTYAIAAWCYRWVILVSISTFLYTVLKPYDLQSLGVTLCLFSMGGIVFALFKNIYQIIVTPRAEPLSKIKMFVSATLFVGFVWFVATIQVPWYHFAPFVVEPVDVVHVTNGKHAGKLLSPETWRQIHEELDTDDRAIYAGLSPSTRQKINLDSRQIARLTSPADYRLPQNGDYVQAGQVIAIIEDEQMPDLRKQFRQLTYAWCAQVDVVLAHESANFRTEAIEAVAELHNIESQITQVIDLMNTRVIKAAVSGKVVATARVPEQKRDDVNRTKLNRWYGTPLDHKNRDCYVDAGMELFQIAPSDQLQAVLYIDQADREDITDTAMAELKLEHLPDVTYTAPITVLSPRDEKVAPPALTTQNGGTLATRPDDRGQQTLAAAAVQAIVEMHFVHPESQADAVLLKPGMRGEARFLVDDRTVWEWGQRYFFETFRFQLN